MKFEWAIDNNLEVCNNLENETIILLKMQRIAGGRKVIYGCDH